MEALLQVSLAINAELDVSEVLKKVVYWARKLVDCSDASILIWDAHKEIFLQGASTDEREVAVKVRRTGGSTRWIVDKGKPLIIPDIVCDPHTANDMLTESRMRSYAGVPIIHGNRTIAVLYALSHEQRNFDQGEMEILSMLASMAAVSIANAQLVENRQLLHEQRKSLMRLVVHDLLNPLTNIQGFFELLMVDLAPVSADHKEWAQIVHRSLDSMRELIQEITRYEKVVENDALNRQRLDLAAIGRAVMKDIQLSAAAKQLTLSPPPLDQAVEFMGDSILLTEAVYNLVSNAVKYTRPGGTISLRVTVTPDEIILSVSDSGAGIAPKNHEAIFEIFHRVSDDTAAEGSGLGLHLVRAIVKRHGGDITVESELGQGATFHVHLPTPTFAN
ncbi:MAG: GAF domain-containing sensor histidine kinase [Caldilineaceae bacterium]|nr:GAF domain-containing sensor histidine kinase [Caldilineaceae bacterium]MBP8110660.1 GAF domain-containing sensor histidine kinase [Caldilineaceae bacterium]MBP8124014.1 GAF domain-containing sensor histidine kinase [Caldilineaceae bacterium]MBP9074047.1 GAF domain-containing sensor histidine kinase [Caldilineaceae bacterium]